MKINAIIIVVIYIFSIYGCQLSKKINNNLNEPDLSNTIFKGQLYDIIYNYIKEVDKNFLDKNNVYYNIYFYELNSSSYFTIWSFVSFPDYISTCVDISEMLFHLTKVNNRKVIAINKKGKFNNVFTQLKKNISLAEKERNLDRELVYIYDGPLNFRTYKIIRKDNFLKFVKIERVINDFWNCNEDEIIIIDADKK